MTLDEAYENYRSLGLGGKNGISPNFVPGKGPTPAKIMLIGEAPGEIESKTGEPFVGPSGEVLDTLLGFIHVNRKSVFLTNVFKYRPPENRDPFSSEIIASLPCLSAEIKCVNPKVIILAGKIACSAVFPRNSARSLRGKVIEKGGRKFVVTYHPGATLHSTTVKLAFLKSDFRLAGEALK